MSALATSLLVASLLTQAESGAPAASAPPPPPPPPSMESGSSAPAAPLAPAEGQPVVAVPATSVVSDTSFGVHIGVNLGLLALDLQVKHFYLYLAGNLGIPLVTNGAVGATVLGVGYTMPMSQPGESMWFMDFFFHALPGWLQTSTCSFDTCGYSNQPFVGLGVGVGFRFLHRSGFTMGFKIPVFGAAVGPGATVNGTYSGSQAVATYYMANLITLPIVSFGFRF